MQRFVTGGARPLLAVVFLLLDAGGLGAQSGVPEQTAAQAEVIAVLDGFHAALAAGDSARALDYLAADVVILESGGVEDREHYRSGHLASDMRFAAAIPRQRGDVTVRVVGDVAWAHSASVVQGQMGEREVNSQSAELAVLVREAGAWKIHALHWSSRQRRGGGE
jgi:ketosteroid isomerase-like protein